MGRYATFQAGAYYTKRTAGAAIEIGMVRIDNPTEAGVSGFSSGHSPANNFEQIPIEEGGDAKVAEIVTGRYDCGGSINGFFTPERGDVLPSGQSYLTPTGAMEWNIFSRIGQRFPGAGVVLGVSRGAKINRVTPGSHGSRGPLTLDVGYLAEQRLTGLEWAQMSGTL